MDADCARPETLRFATETVRETENKCNENPLLPNRNAERELIIPRSTLRHVLRTSQKMFPCIISFLQQLLPKDYVKNLN